MMRATLLSLPLVALIACGGGLEKGDLPDVDCSQPIPRFAEVEAFNIDCRNCHDSQLQGTSRKGAPAGIDYDVYARAVQWKEATASTVYVGTMPVESRLKPAEEKQLYLWSLCGTPQ